MRDDVMRRLVVAALFASTSLAPLAASALPGQQFSTWLAWTKNTAVLRPMEAHHSDVTGGTTYAKEIRAGGLRLSFGAEPNSGPGASGSTQNEILGEELAVLGVPLGYDLRKHRDVAVKMMQIVYGPAIASDLRNARLAGDFAVYHSTTQRFSVLEGGRYAYQLSGPAIFVFERRHLREGLANAPKCASVYCGE